MTGQEEQVGPNGTDSIINNGNNSNTGTTVNTNKRPLQELLAIDPDSIIDEDDRDENGDVMQVDEQSQTDVGTFSRPSQQQSDNQDEPLCVECGDQAAETICLSCDDYFCTVCFDYLHRTGNRKTHKTKSLNGESPENDSANGKNLQTGNDKKKLVEDQKQDEEETKKLEEEVEEAARALTAPKETDSDRPAIKKGLPSNVNTPEYILQRIKYHSKYVPMRLTFEERKLLRLLEAALNVSEYTDKIDIVSYTSKTKRIIAQLREMCSILSGLVVASSNMDTTNTSGGRTLFGNRSNNNNSNSIRPPNANINQDGQVDFSANAQWYQDIFEIGRRYKIMNPEKMRDSFGKLMYMLMDSRLPEIREAMEFDLYKPVKTVYSFLKSKAMGGNGSETLDLDSVDDDDIPVLGLFNDPLLIQATMEIIPEGKARATIQREIQRKETAIKILSKKYSSAPSSMLFSKPSDAANGKKATGIITADDICQSLYSIGDYHAYLRSNRYPVEEMIRMLTTFFDPNSIGPDGPEFSLGISMGRGGARLSHNHTKQFHYVHQSLTLWSLIMQDMFLLWSLADDDLTNSRNRYTLADTGQGLNRVKPCPKVGRTMHTIVKKAMDRTGTWIGSSVIHLGDRTVPNALFFLDKYLQVPRILTPVYLVIKEIDKISRDPFIHEWIENQFGSVEGLKKTILADFFKHAFDGSGADNGFDAGSCIDGRLTSAWNWENSIAKKPYYKIFLVCGFTGFND